jgi:hypothetical protein
LHRANGRKLPVFGMFLKYRKRGTDFVTVDNLWYMLKREKIGKKTLDEIGLDDPPVQALNKSAV